MTNHLKSPLRAILLPIALCCMLLACGESAIEETKRRAAAIEDSIRRQDDREARSLLDSLAAEDDTLKVDSIRNP